MELKPTKDKAAAKPQLNGVGQVLAPGESSNPWATLAKGTVPPSGGKRRRPFSDTLGATPPRDGPWTLGAIDVALNKPPRTRKNRSRDGGGI